MMFLVIEQALNGVQLGVTLFLLAAGLSLILGIMNLVNLAHGSLYMIGAYVSIQLGLWLDSLVLGILVAIPAVVVIGMVVERIVISKLYERHHLDQVLATFGLMLIFNELVAIMWGRTALFAGIPSFLSGRIEFIPGAPYPVWRLVVIAVGCLVALFLYFFIERTRIGMLIRAGASNRQMVGALGVNVRLLYTVVFGLGAALAGLAGMLTGPIRAVMPGMAEMSEEPILLQVFVVIVVGGIGSIRGALIASLIVGMVDTIGRVGLPLIFALILPPSAANTAGPAIASMMIYLVMAVVLIVRPRGLFSVRSG